MKQNYIKAFNELQAMGCPVFVHCDAEDRFDIDGESPESYQWIEYYGYNGYPFINEEIDAVLSKHGLYAEWMNPAHMRVFSV